MRPRYPENGLEVFRRRKAGVHLVAIAVASGPLSAASDLANGEDTDWIGVTDSAPVGAYEFPMVAGLVCLVYGWPGSKRPFAVADRLFRAGALQVWLDQPDGLHRLQRPVPGKPVLAVEGPLTIGHVLSQARARRLSRGAA